ncbi:hypothetical protein AB1Y20_006157 [Prymnesium parvum]|uniref:FACT complex subunit n=1 Tax=Prymnesium parvum TaxID=97485 RepID=A0AB34J1X2_PRYPA
MAPPALFTADPAGRAPAPPGSAGATVAWLAATLEKSLFVSQDDRKFLFVRARARANGKPVVVLTSATDSTAGASEVEVPLEALRDTSVQPHIAKIFLSLFNTPIPLADEEVTALRARTGDATVQKVVVARLKSDGVTVTRGQSTLNVASFLSLVAPKLTSIELVLPVGHRGGEQRQEPAPAAAGTVSFAPMRKLAAMAAVVGAFPEGASELSWADAEAFFSAALGREVAGRSAVLAAAMRLDTKLVTSSKVKSTLKAAIEMARAAGAVLSIAERGELLAAQGIPSATPSPARAPRAAKRKEREQGQQPMAPVEAESSRQTSSPARGLPSCTRRGAISSFTSRSPTGPMRYCGCGRSRSRRSVARLKCRSTSRHMEAEVMMPTQCYDASCSSTRCPPSKPAGRLFFAAGRGVSGEPRVFHHATSR